MHRIQFLLDRFETSSYLEIGVQRGKTFKEISAKRKVAVDPIFHPEARAYNKANETFFEVNSDDFFASNVDLYSVIFLDGLHVAEQTYRDFCHSVSFLEPDGFILIDDVMPEFELGSLPERPNRNLSPDRRWWGDVYKVPFMIATFHKNWDFCYLTSGNPQFLVWRKNQTLKPAYNVEPVDFSLKDLADMSLDKFLLLRKNLPQMKEIEEVFS